MTISKAGSETDIKRCAVCRIDLKGRFVFVDEKAQALFGLSLEELFAQPLTNFLHEADHDTVNRLLCPQNRYESFYKTTHARLISKDGEIIPASMTASLSFAAGNPVNFLLLINPDDSAGATREPATPDTTYDRFLEAIEALDDLNDLSPALTPLQELVGEVHVLLYRINGSELELLARTDEGAEIVPDPGQMHSEVATTGREYCFTDHESVSKVVESTGAAPDEYVTQLLSPNKSRYLLRFFFHGDTADDRIGKAVNRARMGVRLLAGLIAAGSGHLDTAEPVAAEADPVDSDRLQGSDLTHAVDHSGICVLTFADKGIVVLANQPALALLTETKGRDEDRPDIKDMSYESVIRQLAEYNTADTIRRVETLCRVALMTSDPVHVSLPVMLPDRVLADLVIFRGTSGQDNSELHLTIVPTGIRYSEQASGNVDSAVVNALVSEIRSVIDTASELSDKLGHQHYHQFDTESNFNLLCLKDNLDRTRYMVSAFADFLEIAGRRLEIQTADLNLLFNEVHQTVGALLPKVKLNVEFHDLPKIMTDPPALTEIISLLITDIVPASSDGIVNLAVSVTAVTGRLQITIKSDITPSREHLAALRDFFARPSTDYNMHLPSTFAGLYTARYLLHKLGGAIGLNEQSEGVEISLQLPDSPAGAKLAAGSLSEGDLENRAKDE